MNQTEKKQNAVLKTTLQLINEKAISDITVDEIAQLAEVSKVTLFKYFKNKNHLMNVVLIQALQQMVQKIDAIIESDLDFESTYRAVVALEREELYQYRPFFSENLMFQYSKSPDFFDDETLKSQSKIYEALFQKGKSEGVIDANFSKSDFMMLITIFMEGMKKISAEQLFEKTETLTQFFLHGLSGS